MDTLNGKVFLVTGAGSGIGRATALELARRGAGVAALGRTESTLAETARAARGLAGELEVVVADACVEHDVARATEQCLARFGRLDGAVHAAGATFAFAPTHALELADYRSWIDGYLTSAFLVCKHALRACAAHGGSLVNIGTFVGTTKCMPGAVGYASAKTGLLGLTRTIAREYADQNVRANLLIVGGTDTPMADAWMPSEEQRDGARKLHALARLARPDEIARAAAYLLSDDASFVTGTALSVEGGLSLV